MTIRCKYVECSRGKERGYLLLKGGHAGHKQHGSELDGALHIEVGVCERLQELLEGLLEEGIVLILTHLSQKLDAVHRG